MNLLNLEGCESSMNLEQAGWVRGCAPKTSRRISTEKFAIKYSFLLRAIAKRITAGRRPRSWKRRKLWVVFPEGRMTDDRRMEKAQEAVSLLLLLPLCFILLPLLPLLILHLHRLFGFRVFMCDTSGFHAQRTHSPNQLHSKIFE
jgi:hypothetical protein